MVGERKALARGRTEGKIMKTARVRIVNVKLKPDWIIIQIRPEKDHPYDI